MISAEQLTAVIDEEQRNWRAYRTAQEACDRARDAWCELKRERDRMEHYLQVRANVLAELQPEVKS